MKNLKGLETSKPNAEVTMVYSSYFKLLLMILLGFNGNVQKVFSASCENVVRLADLQETVRNQSDVIEEQADVIHNQMTLIDDLMKAIQDITTGRIPQVILLGSWLQFFLKHLLGQNKKNSKWFPIDVMLKASLHRAFAFAIALSAMLVWVTCSAMWMFTPSVCGDAREFDSEWVQHPISIYR